MTKRVQRTPARPIRTKRDFEGASAVVKRLSGETGQNAAAEARLQLLLRELDKFDQPEDDAPPDPPDEFDYSGPRRRWTDDTPGSD